MTEPTGRNATELTGAATSSPVDADIAAIEDDGLRRRIADAFGRLRDDAEYGLVFEKHRPESVVLYGHPVSEDAYVTMRSDPTPENAFRVAEIDGDTARLIELDERFKPTGRELTAVIAELIPVVKFGTPIFPGLIATGDVLHGGDKPFHTVINGENYHVLETLLYAYEGTVDCIYIDPPYNSGARDWKYNNNYVEADDRYRHSKWLSFMERRLKLAQRLLNPADSVLIVTIDLREVHRLGLLLEQTFRNGRIRMISTLINPKGVGVTEGFKRVDEYVFTVRLGDQGLSPSTQAPLGSRALDGAVVEQKTAEDDEENAAPRMGLDWQTARRRDLSSVRPTRPGQFYPIYVNEATGRIEAVGKAIPHQQDRRTAPSRKGCMSVFPVRDDGTEMNWGVTAPTFIERWQKGYARAGRVTPGKPQPYIIQYLKSGPISDIEEGRAIDTGQNPDGSRIAYYEVPGAKAPPTQWHLRRHNAEHYGTKVLRSLLGGRAFPFPKSLYAVEDVLRLFVSDKPEALIVDFFGGSGTTAHAVMRLNRQDGGRRRAIVVTNNEVGAKEQEELRASDLYPGDSDWEKYGICEHITKPRIRAAITGRTPDGVPVNDNYRFTDVFPMSEGFAENARFLNLTYLNPDEVEAKQQFLQIAQILWLIAGAEGAVIESEPVSGWSLPDDAHYAVLFRNKGRASLAKAMTARANAGLHVRHIFIVADSSAEFTRSLDELSVPPEQATRLYRDYLKNFRTNVVDTQESL